MVTSGEPAAKRRSITGQLLIMGHRLGVRPTPHGADGRSLRWVGPTRPAILPLYSIHVPDRIAGTLRHDGWAPAYAGDPKPIIEACAATHLSAPRDWNQAASPSWVDEEIMVSHLELAQAGRIQAIACRRGGRLVGGLFGISVGAVFFGEGLFARTRDAGEVALAELLGRLRAGGFRFVDLHFLTGHDVTIGTLGNVRGRYRAPEAALEAKAEFPTGSQAYWPQALDEVTTPASRVA
jgi:leucyl/phenylalanyl-tRNA--protein transferase